MATASLLGADVAAEPEADVAEALEAEAELALELTLDMCELDALADEELTLADEADAEDEADESVVVLLAVPVLVALPVVEALAPSHRPTQVAPATTKPGVKL
jgi:prephenate dehydrogenase